MFWTREHLHTIDFIHFHRSGSTYGAPLNFSVEIRVHFGIRVLNDSFEGPVLNGPFSDPALTREGHYHLRFNTKSGSTYARCIDDLVRFTEEKGEPWFSRFQDMDALVGSPDSPLSRDSIELLKASIRGEVAEDHTAKSKKILGLKNAKK